MSGQSEVERGLCLILGILGFALIVMATGFMVCELLVWLGIFETSPMLQ